MAWKTVTNHWYWRKSEQKRAWTTGSLSNDGKKEDVVIFRRQLPECLLEKLKHFRGHPLFSAGFEEPLYSNILIFPFNLRHFRRNYYTSHYILFDSCSLQIQNLHENIKAGSWLHTFVIFYMNWGLRIKLSLLKYSRSHNVISYQPQGIIYAYIDVYFSSQYFLVRFTNSTHTI